MDWWLPRLITVAAGILLVSGAGFRVVFPWLLAKHNPMPPLNAFGRTLACVIVAATVLILAVYWNQLGVWLWGVAAAGCVFSLASLALFRSTQKSP